MGILKNNSSKDKNILTENGFKYTSSSATGALQNCYERAITLDCSYVMWVAVKTDTSEVYIYVEFACGGEIASYDCQLDNSFDDENAFFNELDELITERAKYYNDMWES